MNAKKFKVGDWVGFSTIKGDKVGVITDWFPRRNYYSVTAMDGTSMDETPYFRREEDLRLYER